MDIYNNGTKAVHMGNGMLLEPGDVATVSKKLGVQMCDVCAFVEEVKPKAKPTTREGGESEENNTTD